MIVYGIIKHMNINNTVIGRVPVITNSPKRSSTTNINMFSSPKKPKAGDVPTNITTTLTK